MTNPYQEAFDQSINDPEGFWGKAAEDCHWYKRWDKVLDDSNSSDPTLINSLSSKLR